MARPFPTAIMKIIYTPKEYVYFLQTPMPKFKSESHWCHMLSICLQGHANHNRCWKI